MALQFDNAGQPYFDGDFLITAAEVAWLTRPAKLPKEATQPLLAEPKVKRPRGRPRKDSLIPSVDVAK